MTETVVPLRSAGRHRRDRSDTEASRSWSNVSIDDVSADAAFDAAALVEPPMVRPRTWRVTVLIPAHNEGTPKRRVVRNRRRTARTDDRGIITAPLTECLNSLERQSVSPDRVVVLADNCVDDTVELARQAGVDVFTTVDNQDKKAGALNQWLGRHLDGLTADDLVLVMDADSELDPDFVSNALGYIRQGYDAVGGIFLGKDGGGLVGMFQRNEYARYARDVARKNGRTLVLTGTATLFVAEALQDVVAGRRSGEIPGAGAVPTVYDTTALTEDNELTFALLHLDKHVIAPPECTLRTEVMETWSDLRRQRFRWKRGAIENNAHYGLTRHTLKYQLLQWWSAVGIVVTVVYLSTLGWAIASGHLRLVVFWILVTGIYSLERVITVRARGPKQMLIASVLLIEMPYDLTLQIVQAKAFVAALFRTERRW
jgi:poly-beta-1,6-N-acetyl-D-glucosamine synthase